MRPIEKWIWLPEKLYPDYQRTAYCAGSSGEEYTVAEFARTYCFEMPVIAAKLRFSGDTEFVLYCNEQLLATGPVSVGGDFIGNELPKDQHYATEVTITPESDTLSFYARVKMMPVGINEYSKGHGGFMLTGHLTFADGTEAVITTDQSWQVRRNARYVRSFCYDATQPAGEYVAAQLIPNLWHCTTAPIPPRTETLLYPDPCSVQVQPGETRECVLEFDKIYAGFIHLSVKAKGLLSIRVECFEQNENGSKEEFIFDADGEYRGLQLHSAGGFRVKLQNASECPAAVTFGLIATHYPVYQCGKTVTSDADLNRVMEVCTHTLQYCRQMIHLDSPRHSEPLACTGDYYIESLMTAFTFGNMDLAKFDVRRTAELLRYQDGRMFHTTYSLIWVRMLWDVYQYTGDSSLLCDCVDALTLLLDRFAGYIGENGLIETPPDYMFVDWIYIDGISLHHPPKALGQTCLNLYYYGALQTAADVYSVTGHKAMADRCRKQANDLKQAVFANLYDADRGLFFEGLNTPTPERLLGGFMPQNVSKRYYRCHANILAAYVGICESEQARSILRRVMADDTLGEYQPYFAHFLLEAVEQNGLREQYTRQILEAWKQPVRECDKGLVEGFVLPEPGYSFDHSHAWGGTPVYALPKALLGFEMIEPGFRKIALHPSLLGLEFAQVELPTPYGMLRCTMKAGQKIQLEIPDGITVVCPGL